MLTKLVAVSLGAMALLVIGAFRTPQGGPCVGSGPTFAPTPTPTTVMPITERDRLEQIAKENPGFGGYYRDRDDRSIVTVFMTDVSKREIAERAARAAVKDPESIREVRIVQADFEFTDLAEWYRLLKEHLWVAVDEITSSCISEQTNRIEIGISDLSAQDKVTKVLNELGIPVDAVRIVEFAGVKTLPDDRKTGLIIIVAAVGTVVGLAALGVAGLVVFRRRR